MKNSNPNENADNENTETVNTVTAKPDGENGDASTDVLSDPARADLVGTDWTDEGGATPEGPATQTDDH